MSQNSFFSGVLLLMDTSAVRTPLPIALLKDNSPFVSEDVCYEFCGPSNATHVLAISFLFNFLLCSVFVQRKGLFL